MVLLFFLLCVFLGQPLYASSQQGVDNFDRIIARKKLRAAADISSMAWYGFDYTTGKYFGFEYEMLLAIAKKIHPELQVTLIPVTWEYIPRVIQLKRADISLNAVFLSSADKENFAWSDCYLNVAKRFIYHAKHKTEPTIEDLKRKKIAVFPEEPFENILKNLGITNYVLQADDYKYFDLVAKEQFFAVIYDDVYLKYHLKKKNLPLKISKYQFPGSEDCYVAFTHKDNQKLIETVNKAIKELLPSQEWKNILQKYGLNDE